MEHPILGFNENRSCIEIWFSSSHRLKWQEFNENRSCIEIKRMQAHLCFIQFNENRSCIEIWMAWRWISCYKKQFNENRSCIEMLILFLREVIFLSLMKTEVVLKLLHIFLRDTAIYCLMKTEVVLKYFQHRKECKWILFNENRSCIEIKL